MFYLFVIPLHGNWFDVDHASFLTTIKTKVLFIASPTSFTVGFPLRITIIKIIMIKTRNTKKRYIFDWFWLLLCQFWLVLKFINSELVLIGSDYCCVSSDWFFLLLCQFWLVFINFALVWLVLITTVSVLIGSDYCCVNSDWFWSLLCQFRLVLITAV